jgi:hypothetical protein
MVRRAQLLPTAGAAVIWAVAGHAQPADVNIEVSECIALESELERYACFERLTEAALAEAATSNRAEAVRREPADRAVASPANSAIAPAPRSAPASPEEIRSAIVALDERRPNEHLITLENGQVWRQSLAKRYPLRVGQDIRIYPTRWGDSFRLTAIESNGYIQVERTQ